MSTINLPRILPDPNEDCITLHKAFADIVCDKPTVLEVICHRGQQQRSRIRRMYTNKYEHDFIQTLKSKLRGHLEKAAILWMSDPAERDAIIINDALKVFSKDQVALTEVLYSRSASQLVDIRRAYNSIFNKSLEEDVGTKTSGDEKKLLLAFVRHERPDDDEEPDSADVEADARCLLAAVSNRSAIDKSAIIRVFSSRSPLQLKAVLDFYRHNYQHSFGKVIKQELHGAFLGSLRVAMKLAKNPINYFAKALYKSMKGLGTDDSALIRLIVTRADIDMNDIKAHFANRYNKSLHDMIFSDTSGHYRTFLLLLIGSRLQDIQSGSFISRLGSWK